MNVQNFRILTANTLLYDPPVYVVLKPRDVLCGDEAYTSIQTIFDYVIRDVYEHLNQFTHGFYDTKT